MDTLNNLKGYDIVLMSQSPRRRELLDEMGLSFTVAHSDADENYPDDLKGKNIPIFLSHVKADSYRPFMKDNSLVIAADTIVFSNQTVLGKPASESEAISMLRELSGHRHEVITGMTVLTKYEQISFHDSSVVEFVELSDEEITYYVNRYKPLDKAGAYGIQEWIGMIGVETIQGSFYNIMGLPVHRLYQALKNIKPYQNAQ